jgi:hypothetical protein
MEEKYKNSKLWRAIENSPNGGTNADGSNSLCIVRTVMRGGSSSNLQNAGFRKRQMKEMGFPDFSPDSLRWGFLNLSSGRISVDGS